MHRNMASYAVVKTILVFLLSLTIGLVLPNPVWAQERQKDLSIHFPPTRTPRLIAA